MPRGISAILQANKMYLRGVQVFDERGEGDGDVSSWHKDGLQAEGQASAPPRRNPRLPVPAFFAQAIERVAWHAEQGHEIVMISGTLEPLAREPRAPWKPNFAVPRNHGDNSCFRDAAGRNGRRGRDGFWARRCLGKRKRARRSDWLRRCRLDWGDACVWRQLE